MQPTHNNRILILSGTGIFGDPWHPLPQTSATLQTVLSQPAPSKTEKEIPIIRQTGPEALKDIAAFDLLVLNISAQPATDNSTSISSTITQAKDFSDGQEMVNKLVNWANNGGKILAIHQTLLAAEKYPALKEVIGAKWVTGVSQHPPIGQMTLEIPARHTTQTEPANEQIRHQLNPEPETKPIKTFDERYFGLAYEPAIEPIGYVHAIQTELADIGLSDRDIKAPAIWLQTAHGGTTITTTLGHDLRGYHSKPYQELLKLAANLLLMN